MTVALFPRSESLTQGHPFVVRGRPSVAHSFPNFVHRLYYIAHKHPDIAKRGV